MPHMFTPIRNLLTNKRTLWSDMFCKLNAKFVKGEYSWKLKCVHEM